TLRNTNFGEIDKNSLRRLKRQGFADHRLATLLGVSEQTLRKRRWDLGVRPVYKRVDSCAAEFAVSTAYLYSTYEEECEAEPTQNRKIMVLGGGPNRIGQGIEFDYCCVHASQAMREEGFETIMVNCNPETVSTDFDTSDRLYFEPLTLEDVLEIVHLEKPYGVIVQFGGQTPLKLAKELEANGVPIIGTSPDAIDRAEDRGRFQQMVNRLGILQPPNGMASTYDEAHKIAADIGYPLIVRPSYVLGGRAMEVVYSDDELRDYMSRSAYITKDAPILLDRFLDDATEVDVDAISDGTDVLIGGIMEHIEQAGVHSGDSACSLPPFSLSEDIQNQLRDQMRKMARELGVVGLINAQFAIQDNKIYVLEVNPRAARTVPFVSKVIGRSLAKIAARCMAGISLAEQQQLNEYQAEFYAVKKSVFPFEKFPGVDPILGPEMRSTGEVMGVGDTFAEAYAKSELATQAPQIAPSGLALISVRDADKPGIIDIAQKLLDLGFSLLATEGTANALKAAGLPCNQV
ncbi:carbamoyl-phosphate synthase large subunit, partial [Patescibacteria group bacterium]